MRCVVALCSILLILMNEASTRRLVKKAKYDRSPMHAAACSHSARRPRGPASHGTPTPPAASASLRPPASLVRDRRRLRLTPPRGRERPIAGCRAPFPLPCPALDRPATLCPFRAFRLPSGQDIILLPSWERSAPRRRRRPRAPRSAGPPRVPASLGCDVLGRLLAAAERAVPNLLRARVV